MEITCPGLRRNDDKMFYRRHRRYANPLASELSYSMADVSYRWKESSISHPLPIYNARPV